MTTWTTRFAVLAVPLLAAGAFAARPHTFDPAPYLADLRALEDSLARGYANLEWQVSQAVVDPVALHQRTDSLIRHASSEGDAHAALAAFGAAFRDGHLRVSAPPSRLMTVLRSATTRRTDGPPLVSLRAAAACGALGYTRERSTSPLARHAGYRTLGTDDAPFRTGVIVTDKEPLGVIRIGALGYDRFASQCERVWPDVAMFDSAGFCASACEDALSLRVSNALLVELRTAIGLVRDAGATSLLVDLTGNGGGTNWTSAAARQFSARPLRAHGVGMIRHPHHERQFAEHRDALMRLRDSAATSDAAWRASIDTAIARTDILLAMTRTPCDRRAYFTAGATAVRCTQLTTGSYTSGILDYLSPAQHARPGAALLFGPAAFAYREGVWSGPLYLLVDRNTASASEEFVVLLKDEGAATVLGQRTYGAGCGYTNGGIGFTLPGSGMRVRMPDCARIRRNGRNEVSGIDVDVQVAIDASAIVQAVTRVSR